MKQVILLTSLLSMPALTFAESPQFFVGAKGGYQWAQDDNYHHSDPRGAIWGIYSGVQFSDSVTLSDNFIQSETNQQARAIIVGHTDSTGTATYNQMLSERRAQAVLNHLVDLGINPERLESRGEGESNPIADNATAEGRAKNRRVEITIPKFIFQK